MMRGTAMVTGTQILFDGEYKHLSKLHKKAQAARNRGENPDWVLAYRVDAAMHPTYSVILRDIECYLPDKAAELRKWYARMKVSFCWAADDAGVARWRGRMVGFDRALLAADLESYEIQKLTCGAAFYRPGYV